MLVLTRTGLHACSCSHALSLSAVSRQDDTPLRAVKTVLSQLARAMGPSVLKCLGLLGDQNPTASTVGAYLSLLLSREGHATG